MSGGDLRGTRVVVTRAEHQAEGLVAAFEAAGASVERLPLLELAPAPDQARVRRAARDAPGYDWLVFTSANAVDAFVPLLDAPPRAAAAVGEATARALRERGVEPALVAGKSRAEGLVEALLPRLAPGARLLLPQADDARPELRRGLEGAGFDVRAVAVYGKRLPDEARETADRLFATEPIGWVTFTSPRIVRHFAELFSASWTARRAELRAASIGPFTSTALRQLGAPPAAEAAEPSDAGLVAAVLATLRSPPLEKGG